MVRPKRPKVKVPQLEQYTVEEILDKRVEKGVTSYYLKWLNWPSSDNTWEPETNLVCPELIEAFEEKYKERQLKKAAEISEKYFPKFGNTSVSSFSSSSSSKDDNGATEEVVVPEEEKAVVPIQQQGEEEELVPRKKMKRESLNQSTQLSLVSDFGKEKTGFERGLIADRVIGATDQLGELYLLVLWEGLDEAELVPAKICNYKIPQLVISFYEERSEMKNQPKKRVSESF